MKSIFICLFVFLVSAFSQVSQSKVSSAANWLDSNSVVPSAVIPSSESSRKSIQLNQISWAKDIDRSFVNCNLRGPCIERTTLTRYGSGLVSIRGTETTHTPIRSFDSNNFDFDMILLSFNQSIDINASNTGWNFSYNMSPTTRERYAHGASVMAFTDSGSDFFWSDTWESIGRRDWTNIGADFNNSAKNRHIPVLGSNLHLNNWLIGSAHVIGHDSGLVSDQIQIAGAKLAKEHNNSLDVSAPALLLLFLLFAVFIRLRKK